MGSAKFFVIHLKEVIKTAIFVILGIILIALLIHFFKAGGSDAEAMYTPGSYSSTIVLNDNPVEVVVTVDETAIKSVELLNMSEEQAVFYPLMQPTLTSLADEIVATQSLDVAIPDQTEYTSAVLLKAVDLALAKAKL